MVLEQTICKIEEMEEAFRRIRRFCLLQNITLTLAIKQYLWEEEAKEEYHYSVSRSK